MEDASNFRHVGGGRKGLFLLLRYLFFIAAAYLLIFAQQTADIGIALPLMIAAALVSNVVLSSVPPRVLFSWYVEAPVLVADTLWMSWALQTTGRDGQELFLLYFFVLFLAAVGENLPMVLLGSTLASAANVYLSDDGSVWSSAHLLRIVFFYTVALFYGHVLTEIRRERQRADRGIAWARELEARVGERTEELRRLYQEALAASRLKSELVANMSHELRTPLHVIVGYSEMLLDPGSGVRPEERLDRLGRVHESARYLLQLVDRVLDLGRIEGGRMPVENGPVSLAGVASALEGRERIPVAPGVTLRWHIDPELPVIETDQAKLTIILDTLIDRAIRATTSGSISVSVWALPATEQVEFRVDDTGPGVADADLSSIFEPFHQRDAAERQASAGVGLGLAIVQRYVALLHGQINVRSKRGNGTSFVVTLPYTPSPAEHAPARRVA
jgi:signal transduction histidine kinase